MTNPEKILSATIAILLVLVVILGYQYTQTQDSIGEAEELLNEIHNSRIAIYDTHIDSLYIIISTLQTENEKLTKQKQRVKIVTIREIDSIARLPFDGKAEFFTREITRTDSSRTRYLSNGN